MADSYSTIPLVGGQSAIVDEADYAWLNCWKWRLHKKGYAYRRPMVVGGRHKTILMHVEIAKPPEGMEVDHWDHNKLNNRRANLRVVTRSQNHLNRLVYAKSKSGVSGVVWQAQRKKWRAFITVEGKRRELGRFVELADAIAARRAEETRLGIERC